MHLKLQSLTQFGWKLIHICASNYDKQETLITCLLEVICHDNASKYWYNDVEIQETWHQSYTVYYDLIDLFNFTKAFYSRFKTADTDLFWLTQDWTQ